MQSGNQAEFKSETDSYRDHVERLRLREVHPVITKNDDWMAAQYLFDNGWAKSGSFTDGFRHFPMHGGRKTIDIISSKYTAEKDCEQNCAENLRINPLPIQPPRPGVYTLGPQYREMGALMEYRLRCEYVNDVQYINYSDPKPPEEYPWNTYRCTSYITIKMWTRDKEYSIIDFNIERFADNTCDVEGYFGPDNITRALRPF